MKNCDSGYTHVTCRRCHKDHPTNSVHMCDSRTWTCQRCNKPHQSDGTHMCEWVDLIAAKTPLRCGRCNGMHPAGSIHMCIPSQPGEVRGAMTGFEMPDATSLTCPRCKNHPAGSIHTCVPAWMEHMNDETPRKPTPLPRQPPDYLHAYPDLQAYPEPAPILPQAPQGWLCPKCHSAHSPQTVTCPQNIFNMQGLK